MVYHNLLGEIILLGNYHKCLSVEDYYVNKKLCFTTMSKETENRTSLLMYDIVLDISVHRLHLTA